MREQLSPGGQHEHAAACGSARRGASLVALLAPPLLLMGTIWFFSAQPDLSSGLGLIDLVGRKLVHAALYGLLCFLWWRVFRERARTSVAVAAAFGIAVAYGAIDEYHQTFVAGRSGSPADVAIDACGAGVAAWLIRRRVVPDGGRRGDGSLAGDSSPTAEGRRLTRRA